MQKRDTRKQNSAKRDRIEPKVPRVARVRLKDLRPAKYNPRIISDEALAGLTTSIEKFGCVEPIIVNTRGGKNTIIGGHQRYRVLREVHGDNYSCLCVTVNLSRTDEKLLNLTLNNPEIQGRFVEDLDAYLTKLQNEIGDKTAVELRIMELRKTLQSINADELTDTFELPDGEKGDFQVMSFTLSNKQAEKVKSAIKKAKSMGEFKNTDNANSNGNALARVCERFLSKK